MSRDLDYAGRTAIYKALAELRTAEHSLILAMRADYLSIAQGAIRTARAEIGAALESLDAAHAQLAGEVAVQKVIEPAPPSDTPLRLVPRLETAPEPTTGDAA